MDLLAWLKESKYDRATFHQKSHIMVYERGNQNTELSSLIKTPTNPHIIYTYTVCIYIYRVLLICLENRSRFQVFEIIPYPQVLFVRSVSEYLHMYFLILVRINEWKGLGKFENRNASGLGANRRNAMWSSIHEGLIIKTLNDFKGFTDDTTAKWDSPSHSTQKQDTFVGIHYYYNLCQRIPT